MKIEDILKEAEKKSEDFDPNTIIQMTAVNDNLGVEHGYGDVFRKEEVGNYAWFPGFIDLLRPSQIVELGSAMGVAINCMLASPYKDFDLYGVTLAEDGKEFCFVKKNTYPRLHMITGDYMDLSIWTKDVDLSKTDLFYIDGLHEGHHVREQLLLYKPYMKKGAIVAFDDIFMNPGMTEMWHDVENILAIDFKTTLPLHWTGWGLVRIK